MKNLLVLLNVFLLLTNNSIAAAPAKDKKNDNHNSSYNTEHFDLLDDNPCQLLEDALTNKCIRDKIGEQKPSHSLIARCSRYAKKKAKHVIKDLIKSYQETEE